MTGWDVVDMLMFVTAVGASLALVAMWVVKK